MITKVNTYLEEALLCETLVMATILNPSFRLAILEAHCPKQAADAKIRLVELFEERKIQMAEKRLQDKEREKEATSTNEKESNEDDLCSYFNGPRNDPGNDEIERYLGGLDHITKEDNSNLTFSALKWWKEHQNKYVILSALARDYLGCIASSSSVKRTFSAAAD
ncbi:hypothetical protein PCANC_13781 [Puccinia coronata f. sp. avenae]|uniref:HAT C-terminal dimerisation domain-containing protein n=1 Tax=Puccinia coronata f. sp. avenae TaxID=200324 RepID=A0A2N5V281_9BASI|nr:hypothetical protein PCANC_13781 [Puccinia coronata f. sp. avenae]